MLVNINAPTHLILLLSRLMDSGRFDHLTSVDIREHARERDTLPWLHSLAGPEFDISNFGPDGAWTWFENYFNDFIEAQLNVDASDYKRGLCLLLAWTNDLIRQGEGNWKPSNNIARDWRPP
jgi:hypothetical protein